MDDLERLRPAAELEQRPLEKAGSLEELVAAIRHLPADAEAVEPARGSLAMALAAQPAGSAFALEEWTAEWAAVEAEMRRVEAEDNAGDELP